MVLSNAATALAEVEADVDARAVGDGSRLASKPDSSRIGNGSRASQGCCRSTMYERPSTTERFAAKEACSRRLRVRLTEVITLVSIIYGIVLSAMFGTLGGTSALCVIIRWNFSLMGY